MAPLPDPSNLFSSDIKVYTTKIRSMESPGQLRPRLDREEPRSLSSSATMCSACRSGPSAYDGKDHVAVKSLTAGSNGAT